MLAPGVMPQIDHKSALIRILQMAYSGERAAAFAYQGHWRSVSDPAQKEAIQQIEADEWLHRADVGLMLTTLHGQPVWWREWMMACIGRTVSIGCFLIGWFFPMYLAGQLETNNVDEYDHAAEHARALGLLEMSELLVEMAETEREHEGYFVREVIDHPWLPLANTIFRWHPEHKLQSAVSTTSYAAPFLPPGVPQHAYAKVRKSNNPYS